LLTETPDPQPHAGAGAATVRLAAITVAASTCRSATLVPGPPERVSARGHRYGSSGLAPRDALKTSRQSPSGDRRGPLSGTPRDSCDAWALDRVVAFIVAASAGLGWARDWELFAWPGSFRRVLRETRLVSPTVSSRSRDLRPAVVPARAGPATTRRTTRGSDRLYRTQHSAEAFPCLPPVYVWCGMLAESLTPRAVRKRSDGIVRAVADCMTGRRRAIPGRRVVAPSAN